MSELDCPCLLEPLAWDQYLPQRFVGIDQADGRFGEVNIWQCKTCRRMWLHYFEEYEAYPASGRYYLGLITPADAESISAEDGLGYLHGLEWYLYGGAYFGGKGRMFLRPHE